MLRKAIQYLASAFRPRVRAGGRSVNVVEPFAFVVEANSPLAGAEGVTTESLGIETLGGVFTPLLVSGTAVPCAVSHVFSTAADRQSSVSLTLYRGTGSITRQNHLLGKFQIAGIRPAPRGTPQIRVTFQVTGSRQICLTAQDTQTQESLRIGREAG